MAGPSGTPILPGGISELLRIDWDKIVEEVGEERPREYTFWMGEIFDYTHSEEKRVQVHGLPVLDGKPIGGRFPRQQFPIGGNKTTTPQPYGSEIEVPFETYRDEQYGVLTRLPAEQARSGRHREEVDATHVLDFAFDATEDGFTSGEALCGDHALQNGNTIRNRPVDDIGFSQLFCQQASFHFHGLTNDQGRPEMVYPDMYLLHYNNEIIAREILGSPSKPYTSDNEVNALIANKMSWMLLHFLSSSTAAFAIARGNDLRFGWRDRPRHMVYDDPSTMNALSSWYQRHGKSHFGSWREIYGSPG